METGLAPLSNMEAVQFHPTAIVPVGILTTEGCRGDGGLLKDVDGYRFMPDYHELAELAPRDVVSRAILEQMVATGDTHVYLDLSEVEDPHGSFPTISRICSTSTPYTWPFTPKQASATVTSCADDAFCSLAAVKLEHLVQVEEAHEVVSAGAEGRDEVRVAGRGRLDRRLLDAQDLAHGRRAGTRGAALTCVAATRSWHAAPSIAAASASRHRRWPST